MGNMVAYLMWSVNEERYWIVDEHTLIEGREQRFKRNFFPGGGRVFVRGQLFPYVKSKYSGYEPGLIVPEI